MHEDDISYIIRGAIFKVYNILGPGLFESVYELALCHELRKEGLEIKQQVPIPVLYDEIILGNAFKADILVEDLVIIEVKSVQTLDPVFHKQTNTYLKLSGLRLAILVNFNSVDIARFIFRKVNGL